MHILQNLRLILIYPLLKSLGELCVLNEVHDPRRNLYAPEDILYYTIKKRICQSPYVLMPKFMRGYVTK